MFNVGTRYYKYDGDNLKTYKIVSSKNDMYNLKGTNNNERLLLSEKEIKDKYIGLAPDAIMSCIIAKSSNKSDKPDDMEDVIVSVYKLTPDEDNKESSIENIPSLAMRQDVYSLSKNFMFSSIDTVYIGDCITRNMVSSDKEIQEFMECGDIKESVALSLYVDDTFEDIFKIIPHKFVEEANKVLDNFNNYKPTSTSIIKGLSKSFEDLFKDNKFMTAYRQIFNILRLDFPIELTSGKEQIILNVKQHRKLEDALRKNIKIFHIIKYDKDIDISKVVNYNHIMVSDVNDIIYMVVYAVISEYPVDDDIMGAFATL